MPLEILVVLVVGGISAIAVSLHLLGHSARCVMDEAAARAAWLRQFPGQEVQSVTLAADGHAALVETSAGRGLVWAMGAATTARPLAGAVPQATGKGLRIRLRDYTAPGVTVTLAPAERAIWQERLGS
ncbi:MAG: hypothetical protein KDJ98_02085 [Rhodobacteraceae bacterium]|nr:hypothetical protein [Paracoccaceae bacterium]